MTFLAVKDGLNARLHYKLPVAIHAATLPALSRLRLRRAKINGVHLYI